MRMRFPPFGAGDKGSSEGEGVREGGSPMWVGPSGGGRAGVPSMVVSAGVGGPSDEDGDVPPAGEGPWGPSDGGGFRDAGPSDEFGVAGVSPSLRQGGDWGSRCYLEGSGSTLLRKDPWGVQPPLSSGLTVPFSSPSTLAASTYSSSPPQSYQPPLLSSCPPSRIEP